MAGSGPHGEKRKGHPLTSAAELKWKTNQKLMSVKVTALELVLCLDLLLTI